MNQIRLERVCAVLAVAIATIVAWYFCAADLDAQTAFLGMTPEEFAMTTLHSELFTSGFPSSSPTLGNSLTYNIYLAAHVLGISVNAVWSVMILLEILGFIFAGIYAARILMPTKSWLAAVTAGLLVAFGAYWTPDIANFHFPYYGWTYHWSYAGFLLAITETARNRLSQAAIWTVLSFATHPVIGVLTGTFATGMVISSWRTTSFKSLIVPVVIGVVGCGLWGLYVASRTTISGGSINPELFAALNRAQNFHWYPVYQGIFWEEHYRQFLPLLSMLLLIAVSLNGKLAEWSSVDRQLGLGMMAMAVLTVSGVAISLTTAPPTLIKLALHRADTNLLLAGFFIVFRRLWRDMTQGNKVERLMAAVLLVAPFMTSLGMPAGPVLVRAGWEFRANWRQRSFPLITALAAALAVTIVALIAFYWAAGVVRLTQLTEAHYSGVSIRAVIGTAILAGLLVWPPAARFSGPVILAIVTVLVLRMAHTLRHLPNPELRKDAYAMLDAELWARNNTPSGSLFMPDPSMQEAWRGKSHRPSFGVAREWLLYSTLYNSNTADLENGLSRYRALGLEAPPPYIFDKSERRMSPLLDRITRFAQQRYYTMDKADFVRLANTYAIRYFVLQRKNLVQPVSLEIVFENSHYLIAKAPTEQ
ncbi:hypothetical protein [Bradyrhizobium sp.]|uniref:hypothetical protein n=1 Tax=Bradyrhizobium sp. TaxID=376 RepID=UPI001D53516B|nr:hypothetical protein [Bradyrhizobium sp.]MBI5320789.1 hypothetical protein [Bradyrhizobium sp.]